MNGQFRPILFLCLWAVAFVLVAIALASPSVLTTLGLTTLLGGVSDWPLVWFALFWATVGSAVVIGVLCSLRTVFGFGKDLPFTDLAIILLPPSVGLWVSLKRAFFASESADFLAIIEPILISLVVPLMLFGMGVFLLLPFPALRRTCRASRSPVLLFFLIASLAGAIGWAMLLWFFALAGLWKTGIIWALVSIATVLGLVFLFRVRRRLQGGPPSRPSDTFPHPPAGEAALVLHRGPLVRCLSARLVATRRF